MNYSKKQIDLLAEEMHEWTKNNINSIWINDFAIMKEIPAKILSEFAKRNKKFKEALTLVKDIHESRIVNKGLDKSTNATFIMFILKNIHGWKTNPDTTTADEEKIPEINLISKSE